MPRDFAQAYVDRPGDWHHVQDAMGHLDEGAGAQQQPCASG